MTLRRDQQEVEPVREETGEDDEVQHQSDSESEDDIDTEPGQHEPKKAVDVAASLKIEAEDADTRMAVGGALYIAVKNDLDCFPSKPSPI